MFTGLQCATGGQLHVVHTWSTLFKHTVMDIEVISNSEQTTVELWALPTNGGCVFGTRACGVDEVMLYIPHCEAEQRHVHLMDKVHLSIYCKCCPIKLLLASQCVEYFTPSVHSNAIIYSSVLNNSQMPFHHLAIAFSLCSFLVLNLYSWPFTRLKLRWEHERNSV